MYINPRYFGRFRDYCPKNPALNVARPKQLLKTHHVHPCHQPPVSRHQAESHHSLKHSYLTNQPHEARCSCFELVNMGVSKNRWNFTPNLPEIVGFFPLQSIHFGVTPIVGNTHMSQLVRAQRASIPSMLVEHIGRPPRNWKFLRT